jgi:hypothetical protein
VINIQPIQYTEHGIPYGAASAILVSNIVSDYKAGEGGCTWRYITEPSCHLLVDPEDSNYAVLVYSLQADLDVINAAFITSILIWFRLLESKWRQLIEDIRLGCIGIDRLSKFASAELLEKINSKLVPNPIRADELQSIFNRAALVGYEAIATAIWPNLSLVVCMCGGSFMTYCEPLAFWTGPSVEIFSPSMVSSESYFGVNFWPGERVSSYSFLPRTCFLEFIPETDIEALDPRVFEVDQLEKGQCYELVVTTFTGLYRYRMGDVVRIEDKLNNMPVFDMLYRRGSMLNLFNEMTSEEMVRVALVKTMRENMISGRNLIDFSTRTDLSESPPRYVIYTEFLASDNSSETAPCCTSLHLSLIDWETFAQKYDENLQDCNPIYASKRAIGRVAPLRLSLLKHGAFERLRISSCSPDLPDSAASYSQYKTPRLLKKPLQVLLMESLVLSPQSLKRPTIDELASKVNQSAVGISFSGNIPSGEVLGMLQDTLQRGIKDAENLEGRTLSYGEMRNLFG